ncbi:hypothetical protein [Ferrimonas sp. SCSIO 43195]|uniref:hypothetical protein n=1 Tax=Ferrimonas sp. SCSIO 43195 TaxID=2822844 RepID=UPI002075E999|nr:hypothetical protein [Ferrimonas sp. SCSIO 43195]USD38064.1 hypothetical protein J8Z22_02550 [Ferrimonas sp. SCSIO 43195]
MKVPICQGLALGLWLALSSACVVAGEGEFYQQAAKAAPPSSSSPLTPAMASEAETQAAPASESWNGVWTGVSSSFALPFGEWLDEQRPWYSGWSGGLAAYYPLKDSVMAADPDNNVGGIEGTNPSLTATFKYSPIGNWFATVSLYHYFDGDLQQPWEPDYTYVFGYSDWRPYTLSLIYSNYGGNRFSPEPGESSTYFRRGTWSLGWKFPVPTPWLRPFSIFDDAAMGCQTDFHYTPEYFDLEGDAYLEHGRSLSLGCKYTITGNWYLNFSLFYYPDSAQKQPWSPDFTYGFGYFDWRPFTFSLQYNNYSGNRYPWNPSVDDTGRFKDGALMLAWSWAL